VIQQAVWLYPRFTLGYRDVEDLLAERGLEISNETKKLRPVRVNVSTLSSP
jgi:transposase-like protein